MPRHTALGQKIIESLEQALASERGEYEPPRVHRLAVDARYASVERPPCYDATRIQLLRQRLALSQRVFAEALNVSPSTVRAWEQGIRRPAGPTLRLLEIAEEQPEVLVAKVHAS